MQQKDLHFDFQDVAARYDCCNHLFSLGRDRSWRKATVRALGPQPNDCILDLCCGTGDLVFDFAKYSPGASITGLDISEAMIQRAKQKHPDGSGQIQWHVGNAADTGLPAESFDIITCAFGLRNIADRIAALKEMRRVLRPGGRIGILEFSLPANKLLRTLYWIYLRYVMPAAGVLLFASRKPLIYLARSIRTWNDEFDVAAACRQSELVYSTNRRLSGGIITLHLLKRPQNTAHSQRPSG